MKRAASPPAPVQQPALSPSLKILLGLAATVILLVGMYFARDLLGPLVLGALIVIICHPIRYPLERRRWPRWAATSAVIVVAYLILAVLAAMLAFAAAQFASLVVSYADELDSTIDSILAQAKTLGLEGTGLSFQPQQLISVATSIGGSVVAVATAFFVILAYVIFMAADASRYARTEASFGESVRPVMARFDAFNGAVRRYFVVNATFGLIVAVVDGLALWWLQVPAPLVWAILAFVTNFIPNIGFVLGVIPPALLALVVGGWPMMLAVIAIYTVVNVTLQVMVQPKFVSDAVSLSLTLSFFSVIFWTFIIGPLGAILSIPLTLMVRALILDGDEDMRLLRWFSGDQAAAPPRASAAPAPPAKP